MSTNVVIIGGHGHVAMYLAPILIHNGHNVTSVFRNPAHQTEVEATGATAKVLDVSALSASDWDELFAKADVIVWSAGAGGKGGAAATQAIDQDAAIASIDAAARKQTPPRYIMVSFVQSLTGDFAPDHALYNYAMAKRAADKHLLASSLDHIILGPTTLNHDPASGVELVPLGGNTPPARSTSRELVAQIAAAAVDANVLPQPSVLEFHDGEIPVVQLFNG